MKLKVPLFLIALLLPSLAIAEYREGACQSPICLVTGGIIVLVLIGLFFITLAESILEHGFIAGIIRHRGVQVLALYVLGMSTLIALALGAEALFGKNGAIASLLIAMVVIYALWQRYESKRVSDKSDTGDSD